MTPKGPRKTTAKKAVAMTTDGPQTPYYEAEDGSLAEEEPGAHEDEAVAQAPLSDEERRHIEDHVIPAAVEAMASGDNDAPEPLAGDHCSECFETEELVMVGEGDAARAYCKKHRPLNA